MRLSYAGVEFDVTYHGGTRGGLYEPPEGASVEVDSMRVQDWDELEACHGLKSGDYIPCVHLLDLLDKLATLYYNEMVDDAEREMADDFDPPDDDSDWDEYTGP